MASSRFSSNSPDLIDVVEVLSAFEEMNQVVITLTGRVASVAGHRVLQLDLLAHSKAFEIAEAPPLVSQRFYPGSGNHTSLETAILWALYQLDWKLGRSEIAKTGKTA